MPVLCAHNRTLTLLSQRCRAHPFVLLSFRSEAEESASRTATTGSGKPHKPYGIQAEERIYRRPPEVWYKVAFSYTHEIKTPLLLVAGVRIRSCN